METAVDVVLPCLDEAAALPGVLAGLPPGYRAIVVDSGSTDGSPEMAAAHGARVVHEPRRGSGRAFGYPLELLLRAAAAGWRIVELDVTYAPRAAGTRSKVSGSVRGTARAVRDMTAVLRAGVGS
ncbi:Glycosyl transferase family 2 [Micromonospora rhizosphaerae]|uniref:Glycosyl transferase family 2 n=1 Tax=Micromonospora rhizosphaerae TaxID=568872 RepID=A0A1C6RV61_9ACTN|nr:glycosyltransferase [Micromonospora rhizosphaerae]SCL20900.1 Glycosyl transferase family 2 [Micromonospora rhizosphaerae]